jgi:hypothetical protein
MGAAKTSSKPGHKNCIHRFRYVGDKRVTPVQQGNRMIGYVDGQAVCDANGRELNFKQIGELRTPPEEPKTKK